MASISDELTDKVNKKQIQRANIEVRDNVRIFKQNFSECLKSAFPNKEELSKVYGLKVNIDTVYSALELLAIYYEEYANQKLINKASKKKKKFKLPYYIVWFLASTMASFVMMWGSASRYGVDSFAFGFLSGLTAGNCIVFISDFISSCASFILFVTDKKPPSKSISLDTLRSKGLESLNVLNTQVYVIIGELDNLSMDTSAIATSLDELTRSVEYLFSI